MANFLTCWLQDPGDLPVGDGPPGGSGDGNLNDDDDDDETCNGTLTWKYCVPPQNLGDVVADQDAGGSCDGQYSEDLDCENPQLDCRTDLPVDQAGCIACNNDTTQCNQCCDYDPVPCTGFICVGDGNSLTHDPCTKGLTGFTDVDAYKFCGGKNNTLGGGGCEWDGACMGYYMDNAACKADDPPDCSGWGTFKDPPVPPPGGGGGPSTPPPGPPPDCWLCTGSTSFGSCCKNDGPAKWNGITQKWLCSNHKEPVTEAVCNATGGGGGGPCKHLCWTCVWSEKQEIWLCDGKSTPCTQQCKHPTKEDCENLCEGSNQVGGGDEGYSQFGGKKAWDRIYGLNGGINPIYEKNVSNIKSKNPTTFVGVSRGNYRADLFKDIIHVGITATNDIIRKRINFSDRPFTDLSNANLEKSIHDDLILKLNLARAATGKNLKRMFLSTIRNLIVSNRLEYFDASQLHSILDRIIHFQKTEEYKETRKYTHIKNLNTIGNEADAIELAMSKVWPLAPDAYDITRVAERMKTWKTLATDLKKGLPITTATGATTTLYYAIDDTIVVDGSGSLTLGSGDFQRITLSNGGFAEIPVQSLINQAGILSLEVLQKVMYLLGDVYDFNIKVTTDQELRVDERYGLTTPRKDVYMFALQPGTIQDLPRDNELIAKTQATYKYLTSTEARNSQVNTEGSGAAFPCLEIYLDQDDPLPSYFDNDGQVEITFKDFVLDLFTEDTSTRINPNIPIIARRAPQTVVFYTSNITSNVITHNISKSTSYGVRELQVVINPNPGRSDTWHPTFLKEELAYPARGINPSVENLRGIQYSMYTKNLSDQHLYRSGQQPAERVAWGQRQVYKLAKELKDDYQLPSSDTIPWYEIYDRMGIPQMKYLHKECSNFKRFKSLLSSGKPSSNDTVNAHYPSIKEYRSNTWLGGTDKIDKTLTFLPVKEGHTPIPVEPLE